jgi:hypothetical protein
MGDALQTTIMLDWIAKVLNIGAVGRWQTCCGNKNEWREYSNLSGRVYQREWSVENFRILKDQNYENAN